MKPLILAFLYSLAPVFAAALGTLGVFVRKPGASVRSAIQHFAAGVVFSVVAVELLPDITKKQSPILVAVGFALGIALMLVIRSVTARLENKKRKGEQEIPFPLLTAIGIDVLIDGFLIGIGLKAGRNQGFLLTIALSAEFLSLGLAMTLELFERKLNRLKTFGLVVGTSALVVVGAVVGTTILAQVSSDTLQVVLSVGLAALLYLVTEELLVEAHEVKETPWTTASFFFGFLLFLLLGMLESK